MATHPLILAAIARRTAAGLSLIAYGVEGRTREEPFTCYARDVEQRDKWIAGLKRKGFTVEIA